MVRSGYYESWFIGFGEVASTLSQGLMENGADVYTCIVGRGTRTTKIGQKTKGEAITTHKGLAERSDILISSVVLLQMLLT